MNIRKNMGGDDMKEFSDYEERMISFLMGHGMSTELAEQSVIDERLDQFNDIDHQLTDENQKRNIAPMASLWHSEVPVDPDVNKKVDAFRRSIGEGVWRTLCGDSANTRLLALAIDFRFEK